MNYDKKMITNLAETIIRGELERHYHIYDENKSIRDLLKIAIDKHNEVEVYKIFQKAVKESISIYKGEIN